MISISWSYQWWYRMIIYDISYIDDHRYDHDIVIIDIIWCHDDHDHTMMIIYRVIYHDHDHITIIDIMMSWSYIIFRMMIIRYHDHRHHDHHDIDDDIVWSYDYIDIASNNATIAMSNDAAIATSNDATIAIAIVASLLMLHVQL